MAIRHLVIIEQPTLSLPSQSGRRTTSYSTFASVWATIAPVSGREIAIAKSIAATVSHRIVMPYYPGILPTYRVRLGDRLFEINAILNCDNHGNLAERNIWLTALLHRIPTDPN